jgi:hypothetical protein
LSYSLSTFTLEIDGKPTLVVRAKWQAEADELCRDWVQSHGVVSIGPHGAELRPLLKVRIARSAEKTAYDASVNSTELYRDVKIVKLVDAAELQDVIPESGIESNLGEQETESMTAPSSGSDDPQSF